MKKILAITAAVAFVINADASLTPASSSNSSSSQPRQMFVMEKYIDGHKVTIAADNQTTIQATVDKLDTLGKNLASSSSATEVKTGLQTLPERVYSNPLMQRIGKILESNPDMENFGDFLAFLRDSETDIELSRQFKDILVYIEFQSYRKIKEIVDKFKDELRREQDYEFILRDYQSQFELILSEVLVCKGRIGRLAIDSFAAGFRNSGVLKNLERIGIKYPSFLIGDFCLGAPELKENQCVELGQQFGKLLNEMIMKTENEYGYNERDIANLFMKSFDRLFYDQDMA